MEYISENIYSIRKRIERAAVKGGKNPGDVNLIAVTKTVGMDEVLYAYNHTGQTDFGENRVQELVKKYDQGNKLFNWHLIGHLQKNKVKYVIDKVKLIHSIDSIDLMEEIEREAEKIHINVPFLLQVNISGEISKYGVKPEEADSIVMKMKYYRNIRLEGLMTMAPFVTDPEKTRGFFKHLYNIYIDINKEKIDNVDMKYLSMGMSNDFEIAVEEGSNIVRIGTSIFTKG